MESYPDHRMAVAARDRLERIRHERKPEFRDIASTDVTVEVNGKRAFAGRDTPDGLERLINAILAGVNVDAKDQTHRARLAIKVTARPLFGRYTRLPWDDRDSQVLYTGAAVSGSITLEIPGRYKHDQDFRGEKEPEKDVYQPGDFVRWGDPRRDPNQAPFADAYAKSGLHSAVLRVLGDHFGIRVLVNALRHTEHRPALSGVLTKNYRVLAVPYLESGSTHKDPNVRGASRELVEHIIGSLTPDELVRLARIRFEAQKYGEAESNLLRALERSPRSVVRFQDSFVKFQAHKLLWEVYVKMGQQQEADRHCAQLHKLKDDPFISLIPEVSSSTCAIEAANRATNDSRLPPP
jgi:hypothetical protein